jgi:outer membrane protein insertion porin family
LSFRLNGAMSILLFLVFCLPLLCAQAQQAESASSYEGQHVAYVEIAGRPNLNAQKFSSLIAQTADSPYAEQKVRETQLALENTGEFESVEVRVVPEAAGLRVLFILQPALYFGVFDFSNATKAFSYTQLLQITHYPKQEPYTTRRIVEAQSNLLEFLHRNGYFLASVDPEVQLDQQRGVVNVRFDVNLKQHARFGRVTLTGATPQETERLGKSLRSLRARIRGAYLKSGRSYSLDRLQKATAFLQQQLANRNYLAAQVKLISSDYISETNRADITFAIDQGQEISVEVTGARLSGRARRKQIPIYQENAVDSDLVHEGEQNLASYFQARGFFDVEVHSSMEQHDSGTTILYQIERNNRGKVESVQFKDNHAFSDRDLRSRVAVRQQRSLLFILFSRGRFSSRLEAQSVNSIESLYRNAGYRNVTVTPDVTRDAGNVRVTFKVDEGPRDLVASLAVEGNHSIPESQLVPEGLNLQPGRPYSRELLTKDRDQIMATYLRRGFLIATFRSQVRFLAEDSHEVEVVYEITEGPQVYTRVVEPLGASRTDPRVVLRNVQAETGQPLSATALLLGESRLYSLGIFDWVSIDTRRPVGDSSDADVLVKLHEGKRNSITYSVGFEATERGGSIPGGKVAVPGLPPVEVPSTYQTSEESIWGPTGSVQYTRNNIRGRAESFTIGGFASRLDLQGSTAWNFPSLRNTSWSTNFSLSAERDKQNPLYTADLASAILQFQKFLDSDHAKSVFFRYTFNRTNLTNLLIPELVPPEDQDVRLSGISGSFVRDTRDNPIDAHKGIYESAELDFYPRALGSNTNFIRFLGQAAYYRRVFDGVVWANSVRLGLAFAFAGAQIPLSQAFFSGGGSTLRGFPLDGAGPQRALPVCSNPEDPATCTSITVPVGGPQLLILNSELRFPLGILSKLGGAVFYDGGNVYPSVGLHDFWARYSNTVGVGLRYSTPVGTIRFDVGRNLNPVPGLVSTQYFFTIGQAF